MIKQAKPIKTVDQQGFTQAGRQLFSGHAIECADVSLINKKARLIHVYANACCSTECFTLREKCVAFLADFMRAARLNL